MTRSKLRSPKTKLLSGLLLAAFSLASIGLTPETIAAQRSKAHTLRLDFRGGALAPDEHYQIESFEVRSHMDKELAMQWVARKVGDFRDIEKDAPIEVLLLKPNGDEEEIPLEAEEHGLRESMSQVAREIAPLDPIEKTTLKTVTPPKGFFKRLLHRGWGSAQDFAGKIGKAYTRGDDFLERRFLDKVNYKEKTLRERLNMEGKFYYTMTAVRFLGQSAAQFIFLLPHTPYIASIGIGALSALVFLTARPMYGWMNHEFNLRDFIRSRPGMDKIMPKGGGLERALVFLEGDAIYDYLTEKKRADPRSFALALAQEASAKYRFWVTECMFLMGAVLFKKADGIPYSEEGFDNAYAAVFEVAGDIAYESARGTVVQGAMELLVWALLGKAIAGGDNRLWNKMKTGIALMLSSVYAVTLTSLNISGNPPEWAEQTLDVSFKAGLIFLVISLFMRWRANQHERAPSATELFNDFKKVHAPSDCQFKMTHGIEWEYVKWQAQKGWSWLKAFFPSKGASP